MTCAFVCSLTMRDRRPTPLPVEGVSPGGTPAVVRVGVRDDGRIEVTSSAPSGEPVLLTPEATAHLRNQLGEMLTIALRDIPTTQRRDAS